MDLLFEQSAGILDILFFFCRRKIHFIRLKQKKYLVKFGKPVICQEKTISKIGGWLNWSLMAFSKSVRD